MVYSADLLMVLQVIVTGFCASWIAVELADMAGWREPRHVDTLEGLRRHPFKAVGEWIVTAFAGPRLLLANGIEHWRHGDVTGPVCLAIVVVVLGWAGLCGIVVLEMAFASGLFLVSGPVP